MIVYGRGIWSWAARGYLFCIATSFMAATLLTKSTVPKSNIFGHKSPILSFFYRILSFIFAWESPNLGHWRR
jgi:hypothetical protein